MRFPSKVTPYRESCLNGFVFALNLLSEGRMKAADLYRNWHRAGYPADEFCATMDCLYALGAIELDNEGRLVGHAL
jgi:hypothetical protein